MLYLFYYGNEESGGNMFKTFKEIENFFIKRQEFGIKPGLERIHMMLEKLHHPEKNIKAIHIAGTNGKGSTATFMEYGLRAHHLNVGMFTSPSFTGLCGHIFLNGEEISETDFMMLLNELLPIIEELDQHQNQPTEFEIITVIGFMYFQNRADITIVEAGMGGRLDTTNCFTPILSVITNVSYDHTQFLGDTLEDIAYHKAGIVKQKRPVIIADLDKEALDVIRAEADALQAPLYQLNKDFFSRKLRSSRTTEHFEFINEHHTSIEIVIQMHGTHQIENASLAFQALHILKQADLMDLETDKIVNGMLQAIIPGRFEVIQKDPYIILDGAHNPNGIDAFVKAAQSFIETEETKVVFACFKDKAVSEMLDRLHTNFSNVTLTTFDHPRAISYDMLKNEAERVDVHYSKEWKPLIQEILQQHHTKNECYFITGSLHFILRVRSFILEEKHA